jgi:peroxiredoxin
MPDHDHDHDHDGPQLIESAEIDAAFRPEAVADVASVELDGEMVLLNTATGRSHLLNPTAGLIWQCFDGTGTIDEIVVDLAEAFGADQETISADVIELARSLGDQGLLVGVALAGPPAPPQPESLPIGTEVADFALPGADGGQHTLSELRGQKVVIVNWSAGCGYCLKIAEDLVAMQAPMSEQNIALLLLSRGEVEPNVAVFEERGVAVPPMVLDDEGTCELFGAVGTPSAYLLDEDGLIASELAVGAVLVPELVQHAAGIEHDHHHD